MATTSYGVNAPEAVKLWSRKLFREALKNTTLFRFIGSNSNSVIQMQDDTSKGPGDRVTVQLRMQLTGDGVAGDSTLEGQEEALVTYTDNLFIDQLRHAVRSKGRMTEQRIPWSIRAEAESGLRDWWADRIDTALFNQLAGNVAQSDTRYTGSQVAIAPDSDHQIWAGGATADEGLTSASGAFTLSILDTAVERAKTISPIVRPQVINGEDYYHVILHPYQVTSLRTSTDTGQWLDIQKAAMQGGRVGNNPIFTGALGVYNKCILHENTRIPLGVNSSTDVAVTNTRRALFLGAQAASFATGREDSPNQMTWVEELFDYQNQLGVSAGMIWGAKKNVFNSKDFGSIVLSTWGEAS